jgi:DNA-binding transcriptional LysR family regulator
VANHLHFAALALAEELEFRRAARRLNISVSELKARITKLESLLSLTLFKRDSNHVALTAPGRTYLEQIRKSRLTWTWASAARIATSRNLKTVSFQRLFVDVRRIERTGADEV